MRQLIKYIQSIGRRLSTLIAVVSLIIIPFGARVTATGASVQVRGFVTSQGEQGIANTSVEVLQPGTATILFGPVTTDSAGAYTVNLATGIYDFEFLPPNGSSLAPYIQSSVEVSTNQILSTSLRPIKHDFSVTFQPSFSSVTRNNLIVMRDGPSSVYAANDTDGFSLSLLPGVYTTSEFSIDYEFPVPNVSSGILSFGLEHSRSTPIDVSNGDLHYDIPVNTVDLHLIPKNSDGSLVAVNNARASASQSAYATNLGILVPHFSGTYLSNGTSDVVMPTVVGATYYPGDICLSRSNPPGQITICNDNTFTVSGGMTLDIQKPQSLTGALPAPTGLAQTPATVDIKNSSLMHWNPVSGAAKYRVYRDNVSIGEDTTGVYQFRDTHFTDGTHTYNVTAVSADNSESPASNDLVLIFNTTSKPPTPVPDNSNVYTVKEGEDIALALSVPNTPAEDLNAVFLTPSEDPDIETGVGFRTSYHPDTNTWVAVVGSQLQLGDHLLVSVSDYKVGTNSDTFFGSLHVSFDPPTHLQAVTPTQTPAIGWAPVTAADHYTVYRDGQNIATTTNPYYVDNSGVSSGDHQYAVSATDTTGHTSAQTAPITVSVQPLAAPPTITFSLNPSPNANGWNNSNVTLSFTCTPDTGVTIVSCTSPVIVSTETASQQVTGVAVDSAGGSANVTVTVKLDKTLPTTANPTLPLQGQKLTTLTPTITASASDTLSGIVDGEYYVDTDPGQGQASPMSYSGGTLTATGNFAGLSNGHHTLFVRSKDAAGNWSATVSLTFNKPKK